MAWEVLLKYLLKSENLQLGFNKYLICICIMKRLATSIGNNKNIRSIQIKTDSQYPFRMRVSITIDRIEDRSLISKLNKRCH